MEKRSTLLIREMQSEVNEVPVCTGIKQLLSKKNIIRVAEYMGKSELSYIAHGNTKWYHYFAKQLRSSSKQYKVIIRPSLLIIYIQNYGKLHQHVHEQQHYSSLSKPKTEKPVCPSPGERIHKCSISVKWDITCQSR